MKRIKIVLLEVWIKSFVIIMVCLFNFNIDKNLYAYLSILGVSILLMLSTITISYSMAYYYLRKTTSSVSPNAANDNTSDTNTSSNINIAKYRKSLNTMLLVFIVLIIFYLPFVCAAIAAVFVLLGEKAFNDEEIWNLLYKILAACELIAFVNSTINPLMYIWRIKDMREAVKSTVRRILRRQHFDSREHNVQDNNGTN
jgi:hypothetical protein